MYDDKFQQRKQYLMSVHDDTMYRINNDPEFQQAVADSIENQVFIPHNKEITLPKETNGEDLELRVSGLRTMEAAAQYARNGKYVAVLNFASATTPGGGVKKGSSAQEECLCRVSTLLPCLDSEMPHRMFYNPHRKTKNALHNDDIIYTRDVLVIKDDDYNLLEEPFYVDVITCAAPNLRDNPSNSLNPDEGEAVKVGNAELLQLHKSRARKILAAAADNGVDVVILGAFGCGVFRNPPEIVASAYKAVVNEFRGCFDTVEFAVYCRPNDKRNYEVFKRTFGNYL